jgi:hypothetical protein
MRAERKPMMSLGSSTRWLVVVTCALATTLVIADSAEAGTYVIRNCNVPGERRAPIGPWHWDANPAAGVFGHDECASGGGFGLSAGTVAPGYTAGLLVPTEPGIAIRRVRLWLVARLQSTGSTLFAHTTSGNASSSTGAVGLFGPPGGETLSSPFVSALLAPDTAVFGVFVYCSADKGTACPAVDTNVLDIKGAETTLEESVAPTGAIDGGELLSGDTQSGIRALGFTANDGQSGVSRVSVIVGTTAVGTTDFAEDCAFAALAACPRARSGTVPVDTRKVSDGLYPVSLRVTDAAGNVQTVASSTAIQIVNRAVGTAGQSPSAGASSDFRLTAAFAANRRATLTIEYGRRVAVRGRLRTHSGDPISGAHLDVVDHPGFGGGQLQHNVVTTDQNGRFSYAARSGTSRTLTIGYGSASADVPLVATHLRLRVRASADLHVALNGILVRYHGHVLSKPLPRRGKLVEIQGRAPGADWQTFARRRTSRRGLFSGAYRLRVHRPGVRLQFRVRVPSEPRYPFVAHAGKIVTRIVR